MSTQIEVQIELLGLLMVIDQVMVSGDSDYKKHREKE
jgi:hypothetical protein